MQDFSVLSLPLLGLYLDKNNEDLFLLIHFYIDNYGDSDRVQFRILSIIIDQMHRGSLITDSQYHRLQTLNQNSHTAITEIYQHFRQTDSISFLKDRLIGLVHSDPMAPPSFSLRDVTPGNGMMRMSSESSLSQPSNPSNLSHSSTGSESTTPPPPPQQQQQQSSSSSSSSSSSMRMSAGGLSPMVSSLPAEVDMLGVLLLLAVDHGVLEERDVLMVLQMCLEDSTLPRQLLSNTTISSSLIHSLYENYATQRALPLSDDSMGDSNDDNDNDQTQTQTQTASRPLSMVIPRIPALTQQSISVLLGGLDPYPEKELIDLMQVFRQHYRLPLEESTGLNGLCKRRSKALFYIYLRRLHSNSSALCLKLFKACTYYHNFIIHQQQLQQQLQQQQQPRRRYGMHEIAHLFKVPDDLPTETSIPTSTPTTANSFSAEEEVMEARPPLTDQGHNALLQMLVAEQKLTEQEAWILAQEYLGEENSVVKRAFLFFDAQRNLDEFLPAIKQLAAMYEKSYC